jgi:hypothetical protein
MDAELQVLTGMPPTEVLGLGREHGVHDEATASRRGRRTRGRNAVRRGARQREHRRQPDAPGGEESGAARAAAAEAFSSHVPPSRVGAGHAKSHGDWQQSRLAMVNAGDSGWSQRATPEPDGA